MHRLGAISVDALWRHATFLRRLAGARANLLLLSLLIFDLAANGVEAVGEHGVWASRVGGSLAGTSDVLEGLGVCDGAAAICFPEAAGGQ